MWDEHLIYCQRNIKVLDINYQTTSSFIRAFNQLFTAAFPRVNCMESAENWVVLVTCLMQYNISLPIYKQNLAQRVAKTFP